MRFSVVLASAVGLVASASAQLVSYSAIGVTTGATQLSPSVANHNLTATQLVANRTGFTAVENNLGAGVGNLFLVLQPY